MIVGLWLPEYDGRTLFRLLTLCEHLSQPKHLQFLMVTETVLLGLLAAKSQAALLKEAVV